MPRLSVRSLKEVWNARWNVLLVTTVILFLGLGTWAVAAALDLQSPNTVVLKERGFYPTQVVIEPGETITFVNRTKHAFWPASNPHPQHNAFPTFDAGQPIEPGESFTFTFTEAGKYTFHDHLRSYYTGTIVVGEEYVSYDCTEHLGEPGVDKQTCWSERLAEELREKGASAAFKLFAHYYASDPEFTKIGCHIIAHGLGDAAYGEYVRTGKDLSTLEFPPETMYCGYGYYHGILEHMIRDNPDYAAADAFCQELIALREKEIPRIRLNCYHAIGHGFVAEPKDIEEWGKPLAFTKPGIEACSYIKEEDIRSECFQGLFNVLSGWMWNNEYGLRFPRTESLALCSTYENPEVSRACYYELSMRLSPLVQGSITRLYDEHIAMIEDKVAAEMVMGSAVASIAGERIAGTDFLPLLRECRLVADFLKDHCIKGITGAFIAHGEPEKEYIKAIAFCRAGELTPHEKDVCYENIVRTFKTAYSPEKVARVCTEIEAPYQKYCAYQ